MVMLTGSNNQTPAFPSGAVAEIFAPFCMLRLLAEVSINPPSPPKPPPLAEILPLTMVWLVGLSRSAIKVTLPPLPVLFSAALAWMFPMLRILSVDRRRILPPSFTIAFACKLPVFSTTPLSMRLAA